MSLNKESCASGDNSDSDDLARVFLVFVAMNPPCEFKRLPHAWSS
jgi:hypothetical protein